MRADFSDLDRLAADLTQAGVRAGLEAYGVADVAGRALRDEARRLAPKRRLPYYAEAITHDVEVGLGKVSVEVGPEKGGQGSLGHILEDGTATSPPRKHLGPALDRIGPEFARRVARMGGDLL